MVQEAFGDKAPSRTTTYTWWKRFNEGRESLEDDKRSGRPATAVHDENVAKVRVLLREQPHLNLRAIAEDLKISQYAVRIILIEKMNRRKVCSLALFRTSPQTSKSKGVFPTLETFLKLQTTT